MRLFTRTSKPPLYPPVASRRWLQSRQVSRLHACAKNVAYVLAGHPVPEQPPLPSAYLAVAFTYLAAPESQDPQVPEDAQEPAPAADLLDYAERLGLPEVVGVLLDDGVREPGGRERLPLDGRAPQRERQVRELPENSHHNRLDLWLLGARRRPCTSR